MADKKIYVKSILPGSGDYNVAILTVDGNEMRLVLPSEYDFSSCIGEEISYVEKDGRISVAKICRPEDVEAPACTGGRSH